MAADLLRSMGEPHFDDEPFQLGAFDQIASFAGGRLGRAKTFIVGCEIQPALPRKEGAEEQANVRLVCTFVSRKGQPVVSTAELRGADLTMVATFADELQGRRFLVRKNAGGEPLVDVPVEPERRFFGAESLLYWLLDQTGGPGRTLLAAYGALRRHLYEGLPFRPKAVAPVRTKPHRVYTPRSDIPRPEGEHIPVVMAQIAFDDPDGWSKLSKGLADFGPPAGLFSDIRVKRLGKKVSDPFQILVKVGGASANLIDVGYGVSQALPILVDILRSRRGQMFLMQQPEVHLHPKAQAQLGTFLGHMVKAGKRFVVETHSDYLVDRICLDIRDRTTGLRPDDVAILYFRRSGPWVDIQPISVDESGNIVGAPPDYREFFLKEQGRLFGT
jgi:hypothetical protein